MSDHDYDAHRHEPHSFRGDDEFGSRHFPAFKPYFLRWLLEGYRMWYADKFTTIPPGCLTLKNKLVSEKNIIARFVRDVLVRTDHDADKVSQRELWEAYKGWADGGTLLKKPDFCRGLKRNLCTYHIPDIKRDGARGEGYKRHRIAHHM